ncbi:hypothetical protein EMCG_06261 [[Emmonsia] crescens]|uniref:Uncharacterized protein n=1 Tax=[Emmonsia] crescens TaxID=73230 RepID=A0A0G2ICQ0_9EURO|nr:hypothetical protein EMCG_06261 [Emmonsia crescens UAMH 3008]
MQVLDKEETKQIKYAAEVEHGPYKSQETRFAEAECDIGHWPFRLLHTGLEHPTTSLLPLLSMN